MTGVQTCALPISFRGDKKLVRESAGLAEFVEKARKKYDTVEKRFGTLIDDYLIKFIQHAKGRHILIDGRRTGMLKRNMCAYLAVEEAMGVRLIKEELPYSLFFTVIKFSMPFDAFDANIPIARIKCIHDMACDSLEVVGHTESKVIAINTLQDIIALEKIDMHANDYIFTTNAITRLIEQTLSRADIEEAADKIALLKTLAASVCSGKAHLSPNDQERIMEAFAKICFLKTAFLEAFSKTVWSYADMLANFTINGESKDGGYFKNAINFMPGRPGELEQEKLKSVVKSIREGEAYREDTSA